MTCWCCGEPIALGDVFVEVRLRRMGRNPVTLRPIPETLPMQDGYVVKYAHEMCHIESGAPRASIGAEGGRIDV